MGIRPIPNSIQNLVYPSSIREGPFFEFLRSDVCSLRYECKHASSLHVSGCRARVHARISAKIDIHYTLLINFPFLYQPQILHCLKGITNYRDVRARLRTLRAHALWAFGPFPTTFEIWFTLAILGTVHFLNFSDRMCVA